MYYYDKKFKKLNVMRVSDNFFILIEINIKLNKKYVKRDEGLEFFILIEMNKILFNFKKIKIKSQIS